MKRGFLCGLRQDTDMMWKGGVGLMFILLFLCTEILSHSPEWGMTLFIVYGAGGMAIFAGLYFAIVRRVGDVLCALGDMIEHLAQGCPETVFPAAEDTVLSRLQSQLMGLYDIMHSCEEREQQMRRQLDENIGDLVHQLNTPVTNIRMYTEFLGRDDLTAKERERFLRCLTEQAHKLSWLGESFSKVSRLETGIICLKPERQKLQPLVLRAAGQIAEKARLRGMEIRLKGDVQAEALADARWTAEAVFNVLDNAVKYGDEGSVIQIEMKGLTNYTAIAVRNRGMEIAQEEYHNLFKRFYRGKGTGKTEGSGLGLYIVRKILEEEKGYITAGRTNEGLTEFVLYLYQGESVDHSGDA